MEKLSAGKFHGGPPIAESDASAFPLPLATKKASRSRACAEGSRDVRYWHLADIAALRLMSAIGGKADMTIAPLNDGFLGSPFRLMAFSSNL